MPRPVNKGRRAELIGAVADHFVDRGHTRDSLRAIAGEIGTSARMLIHHFGTRDAMTDAALQLVRGRQLQAAREALLPGADAIVSLRQVWPWFEREDSRRYFLLFEDIEVRERIQPSTGSPLATRLGTDWRPIFFEIFRADPRFSHDADVLAHLVVVALRGFARDRAALADTSDQERAYEALVEMIAAHG